MLSKNLSRCVRFAQFAAEHKIDPRDLAELVSLAHKASKASVNECNIDSDKVRKTAERTAKAFTTKANDLGFGVLWSGLYPDITKGGNPLYLPSFE